MQSFSSKMQGTARSLGGIGATMALGITTPLVGIATGALRMAADFEQSMNMMAAVGDIPAQSMAHLEQQALDLGASTVFSAGEVAEAMLELTKSGQDMFEVSASIAGVTELAAAGDLALGEAAKIATQYLAAFNLEAGKTGEIANLLAGGANASAADVQDLAMGGVQAAGSFNTLGLSASDLITTLAILSNVGQDATRGGTNINQAMNDLISPTIKARKEMKKLGVDLFDVNGEFIGIIPMIDAFNEATMRMTDEQRLASLGIIFSGEGLKAMLPLLDKTGAGFADVQHEVEKEGQAAALAQARMKGLAGGMEYLSGSVDSFLIGTAKPFLDFFNEIVISIADGITGIGDLPDPLKNAALAFGAVLAAAGPLIGVAAAVAFALSALGTAAAPILLVVGAVAALAAGIVYLDSIGVIDLGAMWTTAKEKIDAAITSIKAWITQIQTQGLISQETMIASFELPGNWGDILRFTIGMGAALKTLSGAVTGDLGVAEINELNLVLEGAFGETVATRINNIASHILTLKDALADASTVGEWFTGVSTFATNVGTEIQGIVDEADKQIAAAVQAAIDTIDVNLTIGATNIAWSPDLKSLDIPGVFTAQVTPKWVKVGVGTLTVRATPEWVNIERGEKNILQVQATPDWVKATVGEGAKALIVRATPEWVNIESGEKNVLQLQVTPEVIAFKIGEGVSLMVTPEITSFEGGPFSVEVTPKLTSIKAGELTVDVTPKINELLINGKTIPNLNWKEVIGITIDWATIVPALVWNTIVKPIEWTAILGTFSWFAFIKPFTPADWSKQVGEVDLADPSKTPALNWENFVTGVMLNTVAPVLDWHNFVIGTALSSFVEKLTWGEFIEGTLNWPSPKEILDAIVAAARGLAAPDFSKGRFDTEWPEQVLSLDRRGGGGRSGFGGAPVEVPGVIVLQRITEQDVEGALETKTVTIAPKISWGADSSQSVAGLAKMYEDALRSSASSISFDDIFGGVSGMAGKITSALRTSVKDIGGDLFRDMQPGGADQMANVKVKAEITDATAAANLKPLPMKAIIDEATLSAQTTALSTALQAPDISFSWPPLPEWEWPALPRFVWPALPQWRWPPIDRPAWLDSLRVPRPDWLGQLLSWSPEVVVVSGGAPTVPGQISAPQNAPTGAKQSAVSAGAGGAAVVIERVEIHNDLDLEELIDRITRGIERKGRGLG